MNNIKIVNSLLIKYTDAATDQICLVRTVVSTPHCGCGNLSSILRLDNLFAVDFTLFQNMFCYSAFLTQPVTGACWRRLTNTASSTGGSVR